MMLNFSNFLKPKSVSTTPVAGSTATVKAEAIPASNGTPVSSVQLKAAFTQVALILGGTLPTDIEGKLGESIKEVMTGLDKFAAEATKPTSLPQFETKTKALEALFKTAAKHINSVVQAAGADNVSRITPNQLRAYETTAFWTLKAEFNAEKQMLGAGLVQKEMVAIQTKLAELNPNTKLSNFLTAATACSKQIKELEDVIGKTEIRNPPFLESLKEKLRAKFDGQLPTITGSEMDVTEIAVTANLVHGLICGDPDLKAILTPTGSSSSSSSETWLDKFKTQMTVQFNTKAEAMKDEIGTKLSESDVVGASALLSKLSASVLSATDMESRVAGADGKSSASENVFGDVGAATTALAAATKAVAVHTLSTAVEENENYLKGAAAISAAVVNDPGAEATKLRGRIANLESLATAATATSESTGTKELTDILTVAEALHSVAKAKGVADELLKPDAKPTLEEVNLAIAGCKSAPAAPGSSPSAAHAAVTTLTADLAAKRKVNDGFLVPLKALKGDLTESKRLDDQANDLKGGTPSDNLAKLKHQLRPNSVNPSLSSPFQNADRVKLSQSALDTAKKAVVTGAIADIKTKLTLSNADKLGTTDLAAKQVGFKEALALLTQLKSPEMASVTSSAEITKALTELDDLHSEMKTAIGLRTQNMVDKTGEEPKHRLTSMTQALEFCKAFDVPSAHVEGAIRTVVDAQAKTLDAPLDGVAAAQGPADLVLAIKALREAVKTVDLTLSGVPAKSEVMKNVATQVEDIVKGIKWDFDATLGDKSRQSMASGLALMTELSGIGAELGNAGWPTTAMNTQIGDKLKAIVQAQFESHHVGINSAADSLEAIEGHEQALKATSESMGGPHRDTNGKIGEFLSHVNVVALEGTATEALKVAKIAVAKREVAALKDDLAKLLDVTSMELMKKCVAILGETDGADALALTKGDAATSCKVSELTKQLATSGSVTSIVRELGGLTHGDASHPRTDTAMTAFITAVVVNGTLPPAERIAINAALLKSALLPAGEKDRVKAALVSDMKAQWTIAMRAVTDGLSSKVTKLESQFGKINDLGLPEDVQRALKTEAWGIAKETLGLPVVAIDLDNHLDNHLDPASTLDRLIKDSGDVVTIDGSISTFVNDVKTAQSKTLAGEFPGAVAPTTVGESVAMGVNLSELRSQLIPGLDDGANSLSGKVKKECEDKLNAVVVADSNTALETLFAVKCMMDNFPITETKGLLDAKIGEFLDGLSVNGDPATANLSIEHLDMFHQLTQREGVDKAKVQTARTKVVTSWGADFSDRANNENTTPTDGGAKKLVEEWDRFKAISQPRHPADMDSASIVGIKSTVAFFRMEAGKEDIKSAKELAAGTSELTSNNVKSIITVLNDDLVRSDSQIPVSDKEQMYTKVTVFFDTLVADVNTQGYIDQIMTTLQPDKGLGKPVYSKQFTKATTQLVELAELAKSFSELKSFSEVVPPTSPELLSAADKAVIKLDSSITDLDTKYKALTFQNRKIWTVALGEGLQTKVNEVKEQVAKIELAVEVNISKEKPTDEPSFSAVVTKIKAAKGLFPRSILTTNIDSATNRMLDTQVKAFFDGVKITKANIDVGDDSALTAIRTQLESLDTLAVPLHTVMGTTPFGALVTDAKAPKLEQLKVARLLNRVHNAGTSVGAPAGMNKLAELLRTYPIEDLLKTESFLYNVATGTPWTPSGPATPLNRVIAGKAVAVVVPDEHTLAVMAQVLRSSKWAAVGDLTVAVFADKMGTFVKQGGVDTEPKMLAALKKIETFLKTVGDGSAVQSLPAGVKDKIIGLVGELEASSAAWAGCTALVTELNTTLGATAEQIAGAAAMKAFDDAAGTSPADVKDALVVLQAAKAATPAPVLPSDAKGKIEAKLKTIVVPHYDVARPDEFAAQIKVIKEAYELGVGLGVGLGADTGVETELKVKISEQVTKFQKAILGNVNAAVKVDNSLTAAKFQKLREFTTLCGDIKQYPESVQIAIVGVAEALLNVVRDNSNLAVVPEIESLLFALNGLAGFNLEKFEVARDLVRTGMARFGGMFSSSTAANAVLPNPNPLSGHEGW